MQLKYADQLQALSAFYISNVALSAENEVLMPELFQVCFTTEYDVCATNKLGMFLQRAHDGSESQPLRGGPTGRSATSYGG